MAVTVRPARAADAEGIARVHVQAWREIYAGIATEERLANLSEERRAVWWRHVIENEPKTRCVVADGDSEVVGFASAGPTRDDDIDRDLEIFTIYTLAARYGSGIGQALLDMLVGGEPAMLWVAEGNPRAQAFYRKNGFELDGSTKFDGIAEVRMLR